MYRFAKGITFSTHMLKSIDEFYSKLNFNEVYSGREIAQKIGCDRKTIYKYINSLNNEKDIYDNYDRQYILVLEHTKFRPSDDPDSHYVKQQKYFEEKSKKRIDKLTAYKIARELLQQSEIRKSKKLKK